MMRFKADFDKTYAEGNFKKDNRPTIDCSCLRSPKWHKQYEQEQAIAEQAEQEALKPTIEDLVEALSVLTEYVFGESEE